MIKSEAATGGVLLKKEVCNYTKKETLEQVFSYEFCKIFKNNILREHLRATSSVKSILNLLSTIYQTFG